MRFSLCPDLIFEGDTPEQTATRWIVASASSGWFCHQLSTATIFLSMVCLVAMSNLRFLNHDFYLDSLKDSGRLFSSHWLVLRCDQ